THTHAEKIRYAARTAAQIEAAPSSSHTDALQQNRCVRSKGVTLDTQSVNLAGPPLDRVITLRCLRHKPTADERNRVHLIVGHDRYAQSQLRIFDPGDAEACFLSEIARRGPLKSVPSRSRLFQFRQHLSNAFNLLFRLRDAWGKSQEFTQFPCRSRPI